MSEAIPRSRFDAGSEQPPGETPRTPIAVIITIRNERRTLGETLQSLFAQDYPHDLLEILIVDGRSEDGSLDVVPPSDRSPIPIRIIDNPRRMTPAAFNLGVNATCADAIVWISGHTVLSANYLSTAEAVYRADPGIAVGGRLAVRGSGWIGTLNALVLSSPFGTGPASLRFGTKLGEDEVIAFALMDRRRILAVGGMDERLHRNHDNALCAALKKHGMRFVRVDSVATYLAPPTLRGLWRRAWGNGCWNIWGRRLHRGGLSWWHYAPMSAVGCGAVLAVLTPYSAYAGTVLAALAILYALGALIESFRVARIHRRFRAIPLVPLAFFAFHVAYGAGSWSALFRRVPSLPVWRDAAPATGQEANTQ
ncbi:MAG TPA: glycosyltransferase [candidate division Zixibacteria bacterium]